MQTHTRRRSGPRHGAWHRRLGSANQRACAGGPPRRAWPLRRRTRYSKLEIATMRLNVITSGCSPARSARCEHASAPAFSTHGCQSTAPEAIMVRCCSKCLLLSVRTSRAVASSCSDGTRCSGAALDRLGDASAGAPHAAASCSAGELVRRRRARVFIGRGEDASASPASSRTSGPACTRVSRHPASRSHVAAGYTQTFTPPDAILLHRYGASVESCCAAHRQRNHGAPWRCCRSSWRQR